MRSFGRRAWFLLGLAALAVPLVAAAVAYGCTAMATLTTSSSSAPPGSVVTVTGKYFGTHNPADDRSNQPAEIRLGSLTSPVLASAPPTGSDRSFTVEVTIPEGVSGDTVIVATQKTANGQPVYGTPARQSFTVTQSSAPAPGASPPVASPPNVIEQIERQVALRNAIAGCRKKHSARKAKTRAGKKRLAKRRAGCIKKARKKFS